MQILEYAKRRNVSSSLVEVLDQELQGSFPAQLSIHRLDSWKASLGLKGQQVGHEAACFLVVPAHLREITLEPLETSIAFRK